MPSVEIVCIAQTEISPFSDLPFRLLADDRLVSHRAPRPLFQPEFDLLHGCLYHLCNPDRGYNAYDLLSLSQPKKAHFRYWLDDEGITYKGTLATQFTFLPEFRPSIQAILAELLKASPVGKLLFTSDYQFGPPVRRYKRPLTLEQFWERHDTRKLRMNALYRLYRPARQPKAKIISVLLFCGGVA